MFLQFPFQAGTFNSNPFVWDMLDGPNSGSNIAFMSIMDANNINSKVPVQAKSVKDAIQVLLENNHTAKENLSFRYPGEVKVWKMKLKNNPSSLIVGFDSLHDKAISTRLIVQMRFGKPPTKWKHDYQLYITWNERSRYEEGWKEQKLKCGMNTSDHKDRKIKSKAGCRALDRKSFICQEISHFSKVEAHVWFSAIYDGPMPEKKLNINPFSFSVREHVGTWNFSIVIVQPSCKFWNEKEERFDDFGVEVISDVKTT